MMKKFHTWAKVALCSLVSLTTITTSVYAAPPSESWINMYNINGIRYYNPVGIGNGCITGNNTGYNGGEVFSEAEMRAIGANQTFYQEAAAKYGFEWQIIAAIHSAEYSSQRGNPSNGQGAYQLYSYTDGGNNANAFYPAGSISDAEFSRQTDIAASIIKGIIDSYDLNVTNQDHVKKLFFHYNGAAQTYIERAELMGFTHEQALNGEGSPYVMNRFDAQRDPTSGSMSPHWAGRYTGDGQYDTSSVSTRYGTYVKYLALGGGGASTAFCNNGQLIAGGMTKEQADQFMEVYRNLSPREWGTGGAFNEDFGVAATTTCQTDLENCVAFSQWFINNYTTYKDNKIRGLPDGRNVVSTLLGMDGFVAGGHVPRAYAIFSISSSEWGHTGVVLGIDTENNKIIIGEAGCGASTSWTGAHEYNLDEFTSNSYTYAYTDGILLQGGTLNNAEVENY